MITIQEKKDCCGCSSCAQICPRQCITMSSDDEGFKYPHVNAARCIDCGLCEKVCPVINQASPQKPQAVYAAKNKDENVRMKSSSGGIFTLLAESVIQAGGVVFGARFDSEWNVVHDYTESVEGLEAFRGSKYVQSDIGNNFKKAEAFLHVGRKVLFSGTPCQIAGLKKFLRRDYDALLTVEVVCHGVPSPMVWRDYLEYKRAKRAAGKNSVSSSLNELPVITGISFRDKSNGWKKYGFKICYAASKAAENTVSKSADTPNYEITPFNEDVFMRGFLKDLYLRPSCYHCAAKEGRSGADISIADYWGVGHFHPAITDDRGVGLILLNSEMGVRCCEMIRPQMQSERSEYKNALSANRAIIASVCEPKYRRLFWQEYRLRNIEAIGRVCSKIKAPLWIRCKMKLAAIVNRTGR